MKRLITALIATALTLPMFAQYGHRYGGRPVTTTHNTYRMHRMDTYYGLRVGATFSTVNSDDQYLDGGKTQTGFNGCVIEGEVENSILFRGVHVKKGAKVSNCILLRLSI